MLQAQQWIFLRNESDFQREATRMATTITDDLDWLHEHQYWQERAVDWSENRSSLLTGEEMTRAMAWLDRAETLNKVPPPTPLQRALISGSRQAARRRTWTVRAAVSGFVLFLIGAVVVSLWQLRLTEDARRTADENATLSMRNARKARTNAEIAQDNAAREVAARIREVAATRRESGALASALSRVPGQDLDAMAAAFRGFGAQRQDAPPMEVINGLADAVSSSHQSVALIGHRAEVRAAALSDDGKSVATGDENGTIRLWDAETGRPIATLDRHKTAINHLLFAPGGKRFVSTANDGAVLWNTSSRKAIAVFRDIASDINLRFTPDGRRLLLPIDDDEPDAHRENVLLLDTATGRTMLKIERVRSFSRVVDVSTDGAYLAVASERQGVRIWRTTDGGLVKSIEGEATLVAFLPGGAALFIGQEKRLQLRDLQSETPRFEIELPYIHDRPAVSPDGTHFLLSDSYSEQQGIARETATGKEVAKLDLPRGHEVAFLTHDRVLSFSSNGGGEAIVWGFPKGQRIGSFHDGTYYPNRLTFSDRGNRASTVTPAGAVQIIDTASAKVLWTSPAEIARIKLLAHSPQFDSIVSVGPRQNLRLWKSWLEPSLGTLIGHTAEVLGLAFSRRRTRMW